MPTMTIAQALASSATGVTIADTPANIAAALSNQALLARVTIFTMNANGASSAGDARALAGLGSRFSLNGFRYTVRDNVVALETAGNSAGLSIATALAVFDTAANIIAAASHSLMTRVSSVVMSTSASVTLAGLITMESLPSFSVNPGQTITLADTAANLLAITPAQVRGALKFYTVAVNSTVAVSKLAKLTGLTGFSIANGITVTVADAAAAMIDASATIMPLAANTAWAFAVSDGLSSLLTQQSALAALQTSLPRMTVTVNDSNTVSVASLQTLTGSLTHLAVASGQTLTLADTAANLLNASGAATALASATILTADGIVTAARLAALATLHSFSAGGHHLLAVDTLVNLQGISTAARAKATDITVQDSIAHLVAAHGLPQGTTAVFVEPDALTHTAAAVSAIAALATGGVTLSMDTLALSSLTVADTALHLVGAAAAIGTLRGLVAVNLSLTDSGVTLTAAQAAALVALAPDNLAEAHDVVSDTGAAIAAVQDALFGHGFTTITVNSGTFAGSSDQLFSPALFFNQSQASAQLSVSETVNAAQLVTLSLLPGFSLGSGVALTVDDTMAALAAAATRIATWATSVHVTDSETMTAAAATQLAGLRTSLGNGFSMGSNLLTVADVPAAIANAPNAAGVALAGSVRLAGDAIVTVPQAQALIALSTRFSLGGHALAVADTAATLSALPNGAATKINDWSGQVLLSADATVTVANAQALARFTGFSSGSHHLTISDTAAHIRAATGITMPAIVTLSQAASLTVADIATLAAIPGFANTGGAITVADTPLHLATMPPDLAALASEFVLADPPSGHSSELALNAAQFHTVMALPGLSAVGFHGGISITDTATALAGLGTIPGTVSAENLSGDAVVSALTASTLAHLPNFSVNGHALAVRDSVGGLLSPSATDGFAIASSVGLSQPATVLVATSETLAAIPHITGANVIIADTPAALAALPTNIATAVDQVHFAAADNQGTGYTLDAAHLLTLSVLPNLSPIGLSQPIVIADTAAHLVALSNQIAGSAAGSLLQELSGAIAATLSADATISATDLLAMAHLRSFSTQDHALTVVDSPTALLAAHLPIAQFAALTMLADNSVPWSVSAADATTLAGLPEFSVGDAGLRVLDNVAHITDSRFADGILAAGRCELIADETINAAQAGLLAQIANFGLNGHELTLSDTPANLAQLSPSIAAESTSVVWTSTATVSMHQYEALLSMPNLGQGLPSLTVADTASNLAFLAADDLRLVRAVTLLGQVTLSADEAQGLAMLPNFGTSPGAITILDSAANLLRITGVGSLPDNAAAEQIAGPILLSEDATLTTAQAELLVPMAPRLANDGHALIIRDTPTALLGSAAIQSLAAEITSITLSGSTPWTVSAAAATGLARLNHFAAGSGIIVSDGASNLIAPPNSAGLALATHVTLSADATINVATAVSLHAISNFDPSAHAITISDGAGRLATLDAGIAHMASAIQLSGNAIVSVSQYQALMALSHFSANGNAIVVADTASNLVALSANDYAGASLLSLSANVTMTADQAEQLASLPHFHAGVGQLFITDSAANLVHATSGSTPDDWLGELTASSITLTGDAVVTAWQATLLATLGSRLHMAGHSLIVADTPSNLLSAGNAAGLALAEWETLSGDATVTAGQATQLAGLSGFHQGTATVTVSGAANELLYSGNNAGLVLADATLLSSSADVTVAQAEALVALTGFSTGDANLQIIDTAPHLLGLVGQTNATLTALTIGLSDDATVTAAQLQTLMTLPESFTLNGHTIFVFDTARHIAAVDGAALPFAVTFVLAGDAFISAAQANALAANGTDLGDNAVVISDTAAALLDSGNASGLALATMVILSANATLSATDATALVSSTLFNTGGHHLTVRDSVEAISSLSGTVAAQVSAYVLAADQDVTGSQLSVMAHLGSQFSLGGHVLHVVDTDIGLAALSSRETALVTASVLAADATVTAARAEILAALPGFSLQGGVHLTIQDNVPHLLSLSSAAQNVATLIRLDDNTPVTVTVAVAEADGLAALTHFQTLDATIAVNGTIAELNGTAGWQPIATSYNVIDSVDNILAAASGGLLANAASIRLAANGLVDTGDLLTLAGLTNFAHGPKLLTVIDGPAEVAADASTILSLATGVRINASPFISAAEAEALVPLQNAGMLAFTGSNHIAIEDAYAALIDSGNAGGLALATAIRVLDNAANLLTATAHNWGSVVPYYVLSASATIAAGNATILAGLASHFVANGHSLIVADDASHVIAAAADIVSLGATVQITDTAANVATDAASLISLGSAVTAISFTGASPISATIAAGLVGLQGAFTCSIDVADTAAAVRGVVNGLLALGSAVNSITVEDTAADVAGSVTGAHPLQNLGDILTIVLTDGGVVSAASAAGLLPILGNLAVSTLVSVADTAVHVAASAASLQALGAVLGDVSFTGTSTMTVATAVGLLPVISHLVSTVAVVDTAFNIVVNAAELATVSAISTVRDTAAHVSLNLDALEAYATDGGTVHAITLTDGGTPMIDVSIAQIAGDSDAIALIGSTFRLRLSDTAAHVQSDLIAGTSSILSSIGIIGAIVVNTGTITLSVGQILAPNVDDGPGSALALMTGETVVVTGATVADINTLLALGVPPAHIAISDTATNIQADLTSGSSAILNGLNSLSTIAVSDHGTITLSATLAETAGIANSAHSAMALMTGGTFAIDNASVSDLVALAALTAAPSSIAIGDTAAHIQADLTSGGSSLLAHRGLLSALAISDSGVIALSESCVLTAHVDDGAGSVLSFMTGGTLAVTGVPVADIVTVATLPVAPTSIGISDTAAHIQSDLAGTSTLVSQIGLLSGIAVSPAGTITLTSAQVQAAHVDDGVGSVFDLMTGETLHVTGVSVADIGTVLGLRVAPASITVSDTAAHLQGDLIAGTSLLLDNAASISAVAINDSGAITLTMAQLEAAGVTGVLAITTGGALHVTGAAISDIPTLLGLTHPPTQIAIDDTAGNIEADLVGGSSVLLAHRDLLTGLHISDSGVVTLGATLALAAHVDDGTGSVLSFLSGGTLAVTGATIANLNSVAALPVPPTTIAVNDTAAHIQTDLTGSSALLANRALLGGITVTPAGTITLTSAQVQAAHVDDGTGSIFDLMSGVTLHVSGVSVDDIGTVLGLGVAPASITVSDTAAHIEAALIAGASALLDNAGSISAVAITDSGAITLTVAQVEASGVTGILAITTGALHVTAAAVADILSMLALAHPPTEIAIDDTAADIQTDLTGGSSTLVAHRDLLTALHINDSGVITLTAVQALAAHVNDGAGSVLSSMSGGTLAVTGATIANLDAVAALPVTPSSITVTDTAAHLQADLAGTSSLVGNIALLSGITVSPAGTITLTSAQVQAAHVDDGVGSVLDLMSGETLHVIGVAIADIGTVLGLGVPPSSITVSDTAAHIQSDLLSGTSALIDNGSSIGAVVARDSGTISLTTAQVEAAGVSGVLGITIGATVHVTDAAVADLDTLAGLGLAAGSITVSETAANIEADLTGAAPVLLAHRALLHDIVNSNAGVITLTAAQVTLAHVDDGAGSVLSLVSGGSLVVTGVAVASLATIAALPVAPASIAISDTAGHIESDLASDASNLVSSIALLSGIVVNPAGTITLTSAQVRAAHVDDGAGSVFALMSGETLHVTGVLVADIDTVLRLGVAPASISISDTAAHIQADLIAGTSHILDNVGSLSGIAVSPAGTITLTEAQLTAAGVDDGAGSALALMTGVTLQVTGVPIADIATMLALGVPPSAITVSDTAANIAADLASGSPVLVAHAAAVGAINVSDAGTILLTVAQAEAAGVATALTKAAGGSFAVTGALIGDLDTLPGLAAVPDHIAVSDTAAHIQSDLTGGSSKLIADRAVVSTIANSNAGTVTLTEAQLTAADVDDGAGSVFSKLTGGSLAVTGVTVAQIDTVGALAVVPDTIAISDTAAHLQADLINGSSRVLAYLASISGIAVSPAGTITLTSGQVQAASVDDSGASALAKMTGLTLHVTGVAVADIGTILGLGVAPSAITVSDTAAHIQSDLTGAGVLLANAGSISAITVNDAGTISLSVADAETAGVADVLALATGGHFQVTGAAIADLDALAALSAEPGEVEVSDTAANIQADLAGGSPVLLAHRTMIGTLTNSNAGTITLTDAQVMATHVDDGAGSVLSKLSGGSLLVTGVTVAHIGTVLSLAVAPASITVVDTAAQIGIDLAIHTQIVGHIGSISSITVSPGASSTCPWRRFWRRASTMALVRPSRS